ncbi:Zinc-binding dehydrogenase-like protein 3 [Elsinoe fawcettii]|nr:Zinc-binding dehydrogenase-like protein 3 [Elsinoe fawcettii]
MSFPLFFITISDAYTVHEAGGPIRLEEVQIDDLRDGEVLIETAAGKFLLKPPMILGHEASGIVLQSSSSSNVLPGSKVLLTYSSCGNCPTCSSHASSYCHNLSALNFSGRRQDGSSAIRDASGKELNHFFFGQSSMGRHMLAQESSIVKLPDETSIEDLRKFASLGCGIQTGAGAVLNVCNPPAPSTIAILGTGSVGLSAALAALTTSPSRIILIDNDPRKFELVPTSLRPHDGAEGPEIDHIDTSKLPPSPVDGIASLTTAIRNATLGNGADLILDCVGLPSLIEAAIPALARKGTMVTIGGGAPGAEAKVKLMDMLIGGRSYRGTHQGDSVPGEFLPKLIGMWREGKFAFDELLSMYGIDDLHQAFEDVKEARAIKPVLVVK